jgi:hypothetical protein
LVSVDKRKKARIEPIPAHVLRILDAGGLMPHIRKKLGK